MNITLALIAVLFSLTAHRVNAQAFTYYAGLVEPQYSSNLDTIVEDLFLTLEGKRNAISQGFVLYSADKGGYSLGFGFELFTHEFDKDEEFRASINTQLYFVSFLFSSGEKVHTGWLLRFDLGFSELLKIGSDPKIVSHHGKDSGWGYQRISWLWPLIFR